MCEDAFRLNEAILRKNERIVQLEAELLELGKMYTNAWFSKDTYKELQAERDKLKQQIKELEVEKDNRQPNYTHNSAEYLRMQRERDKLKQAIEEAIEAREAMSFYGASGIRIDVKVITNTLDQIIGILQKAIKEE